MGEKLKKLFAEQVRCKREYLGASEERKAEALAVLAKVEDELEKELRSQPEPKAAVIEPIKRASFGKYLRNMVKGIAPTGAEAEANREYKLDANQIPINMLMDRGLEKRTDDATIVSAGTSGNEQQNHRGIIGRIFPRSDAMFLGVKMPMVENGVDAYSLISAGASGGAIAAGAAQDAEAATFTGTKITPTRLTIRYRFRIEDAATLPNLEQGLRTDAQMALQTLMDNQIVNGNGTAPNFSGITNISGLFGTSPSDDATVTSVIELFADQVNPPFSYDLHQVRALFRKETQSKLASLFVANDGMTALSKLTGHGIMTRVTNRVPAVASNDHSILFSTGMGFEAVAPTWQGLQVIRDDVTDARNGIVNLTLIMLCGFEIIRQGGISGGQLQLA